MKLGTMKITIMKSNLLLVLIWLIPLLGWNQTTKSDHLKKQFKPGEAVNYKNYLKKSSNELEATGALLFVGYKSFLSSQDMASCVFNPSCSVYAMQSIQNDNPLKAYVKIFDRLSRCHPFPAKGEYKYFKETGLYYDPIH